MERSVFISLYCRGYWLTIPYTDFQVICGSRRQDNSRTDRHALVEQSSHWHVAAMFVQIHTWVRGDFLLTDFDLLVSLICYRLLWVLLQVIAYILHTVGVNVSCTSAREFSLAVSMGRQHTCSVSLVLRAESIKDGLLRPAASLQLMVGQPPILVHKPMWLWRICCGFWYCHRRWLRYCRMWCSPCTDLRVCYSPINLKTPQSSSSSLVAVSSLVGGSLPQHMIPIARKPLLLLLPESQLQYRSWYLRASPSTTPPWPLECSDSSSESEVCSHVAHFRESRTYSRHSWHHRKCFYKSRSKDWEVWSRHNWPPLLYPPPYWSCWVPWGMPTVILAICPRLLLSWPFLSKVHWYFCRVRWIIFMTFCSEPII